MVNYSFNIYIIIDAHPYKKVNFHEEFELYKNI